MEWWEYDNLESRAPYDWSPAARGESTYDQIDFHLDLGCGKLKKGRLGIDRFPCAATDLLIDLNTLTPSEVDVPDEFDLSKTRTIEVFNARIRAEEVAVGLPFPENSIESIVSHHAMEHIGDGFVFLMDECYRVLRPGGILRIITPLFPSKAAVEDPDHKRYFMVSSFETFCGSSAGEHWMDSFSVPYTKCRFEMVDKDYTRRLDDPGEWWGPEDAREIRVALRKYDTQEAVPDAGGSQIQVPDREDDPARDETQDGRTPEVEGVRELARVA